MEKQMNKDMISRRKFFSKTTLLGTAGLLTVTNTANAKIPVQEGLANGYINVTDEDYGADPTGQTSSANAFILAAADASATNKPIWVPAGNYSLTDMPTLTTGNLVIKGAGRDLVTITGANTAAFISPQADTYLNINGLGFTGFRRVIQHDNNISLDSVEISDCKFNNISQQVFGGGAGVNITVINQFIFTGNRAENIGFDNQDAAVVKLSSGRCNYTKITDNIIYTIGTAIKIKKSYGFYVKAANAGEADDVKTIVTGNVINNVRSNDLEDCEGIMVLGGQAIITDNHIENVISSNISTSDNEGIYTKCRNSIISGNTLINCGGREGVIICKGANRGDISGTSAFGYDNIISNNTIRQDYSYGFRSTGIAITMDGCLVEGNHISGTQIGISVWPGVSNTIVSNNIIYGLVTRESGFPVFGINANTPRDCSILDNQITNLSSSDSVACYGIQVTSGAFSYSGGLIKGNWVKNISSLDDSVARGIAINLHASGTGTRLIIESNHIDNAGRGILANNINTLVISSILSNTTTNTRLSNLTPVSGWTLFSNNTSI